jgi:hypothetical protein
LTHLNARGIAIIDVEIVHDVSRISAGDIEGATDCGRSSSRRKFRRTKQFASKDVTARDKLPLRLGLMHANRPVPHSEFRISFSFFDAGKSFRVNRGGMIQPDRTS